MAFLIKGRGGEKEENEWRDATFQGQRSKGVGFGGKKGEEVHALGKVKGKHRKNQNVFGNREKKKQKLPLAGKKRDVSKGGIRHQETRKKG